MTSKTIYTPFIPDQYCVYHTTYSGTLLPPNYIGSSSVDNVLYNNYCGSVKSARYKDIWLSELKLHPELFSTVIVSYHDTRSNATYKELQVQRLFNVVKSDLFINRAYASVNGFSDTVFTTEETTARIKKRLVNDYNKTPEQKAATIQKRVNAISNRTPEEKAASSIKFADTIVNRTPEEKAASNQKRQDTRNARAPDQKAASIQKQSDTNTNKTSEEKAATIQKRLATMFNKTPEEKAASIQKRLDKQYAKFFSIITTKKSYAKTVLSRYFPEFKQFY